MYENGPLTIQTPMMSIPWNLNPPFSEKDNKKDKKDEDDEAALEKVAKDFMIYYKQVPGTSAGSYTIDHTAGSYAFDPEGCLRLYIKHAQGPEILAQDLKELLK